MAENRQNVGSMAIACFRKTVIEKYSCINYV